jgi:cell division protein FtsI (penicillin-binding protein 3)
MTGIDRRIGFLFLTFVVLLGIALSRASYLGAIRAPTLRRAAATQQISILTVPAERGTITDRDGIQLAISQSAQDVVADPYLIKQPQSVAARIAPLLGEPVLSVLAGLTRPHAGFVYLARRLPVGQAAAIQRLRIDGLSFIPEVRRVYPRDEEAAQVLGSVGLDGNGQSGIEFLLNNQLHGEDGTRRIVNDALGQPISVSDQRAMQPGKTVQLTIDSALQDEVEQVLAGVGAQYQPKGATAIVMNPNTGAILALANWPRENANDPGAAPPAAQEDQAVSFNYEPGSTFKAVTVAGALQDGLVTPSTEFNIPSVLQVADRQIHDAEPHPDEVLSTAGILRISSNIGADLIGQRLGAKRFDFWVHRFGFGQDSGVDLPGEFAGFVLHWWQYSGSSMGNLPFGQGESVTPMQIAAAYAAIANGGILRPPHIVGMIGHRAVPEPAGRRIISPAVAAELRTMLQGVYGEGGTASGAGIPGYQMAGKTGTANIAIGGRYSDSAYVASFVGMVPASHPQLLALVVVNQPQGSIYGGSVAAPAFQKIMGWAVPYFGISPH